MQKNVNFQRIIQKTEQTKQTKQTKQIKQIKQIKPKFLKMTEVDFHKF